MRLRSKARWIGVLLIPIMVFSLILAVTPPVVKSQGGSEERIESDDARVGQSGSWTAQSVSGGSYLYSTGSEADVLTLEFVGTSVEVIYVSGPSLGTLAIEVDGTVLRTVITTAGEVAYAQSSKVSYLSNESHTLKVYAQEGGIVGVDAFVVRTEEEAAPESTGNADATIGHIEGVPPAVPEVVPSAAAPVSDFDVLIGEPQDVPATIVINELIIGPLDDAFELYNPTNAVVNLSGWRLQTFLGAGMQINYLFPAFNLYPGAYVVVHEGAGTNNSTHLYSGQSAGNDTNFAGAASLLNNLAVGVDFVRWSGSTITPPAGTTWGSDAGAFAFSVDSIGRAANSNDNNTGSDWTLDCQTAVSANNHCLVINEVFYGGPDTVELYNGSSTAINLDAYRLEIYDFPAVLQINFDMPNVTIQPGAFLSVIENSGTNTATTIYLGVSVSIQPPGSAVILYNATTPIDFVRWGSSTVAIPAGTGFSGTYPPVPVLSDGSLARAWHDGYDNDRASDWCGQVPTILKHNNSCIVINEVDTGDPDIIELYNDSTTPFTLTGWNVEFFDSTGVADINFSIPAFTLPAGGYVQIHEGAGTSTATILYTTTTITDWATGTAGSARVLTPFGTVADFVRWGTAATPITGQDLFSGPTLANAPAGGRTFQRNTSSADRNITDDWCVAVASIGARNPGCPGQLALFLPSSNFVSLIDSNAIPPTSPSPNDYYSYALTLPGGAVNGQWVMGDWDGDGDRTPGVYFTTGPAAGVYYITNDVGPNATWVATWFGLFAGVAGNTPVTGRFGGGLNDCLGVMDSQNFPPFGTAFALYFTCVTAGGNPAKTVQWNSILLPDSGGFTGTFQFSAGDFDNNGIDSIACRRGEYITWTNTNPAVVNGEFPNAQYIGTPPASSGVSYFVVGDWDTNGLDSFGLFYSALGRHYFRNDLLFNSGVYGYQELGLPLGPTATAGVWTGY